MKLSLRPCPVLQQRIFQQPLVAPPASLLITTVSLDKQHGEARAVPGEAEAATGPDGSDLPPELRMDDYDDEPGLAVAASDDGARGNAMDEDSSVGDVNEEEEEKEEEGEGAGIDGGGITFAEDPSTGQVDAS